MTDYKHLRELAEAATPGPWEEDDNRPFSRELQGIFAPAERRYVLKVDFDHQPTNANDPTYISAANPQTMIALLDERDEQTETIRLLTLVNEGHVARIAGLQARIDAALAYIDDPGNWGTYDGRRRLLHDLLSAPTENGEEQ